MTATPRRRRTLSTLLTTLALLAVPTAAFAGTTTTTTTTGRSVDVWWTQIDTTTGPFGNWHEGYLSARQAGRGKADVNVHISDWQCDEGETPYGGHFGEGESCEYLGERFGEGRRLAFSMNKSLSAATLKGSVTLYGGAHGEEGPVGTPAIDISITGKGPQTHYSSQGTFRRGNETQTYSDEGRSRDGVVTGTLGPMGFDPDLSGATMSKYSSTYTSTYR